MKKGNKASKYSTDIFMVLTSGAPWTDKVNFPLLKPYNVVGVFSRAGLTVRASTTPGAAKFAGAAPGTPAESQPMTITDSGLGDGSGYGFFEAYADLDNMSFRDDRAAALMHVENYADASDFPPDKSCSFRNYKRNPDHNLILGYASTTGAPAGSELDYPGCAIYVGIDTDGMEKNNQYVLISLDSTKAWVKGYENEKGQYKVYLNKEGTATAQVMCTEAGKTITANVYPYNRQEVATVKMTFVEAPKIQN